MQPEQDRKDISERRKFNVLNDFICCKGRLERTKYRINKKYTCSKFLLKIQQ